MDARLEKKLAETVKTSQTLKELLLHLKVQPAGRNGFILWGIYSGIYKTNNSVSSQIFAGFISFNCSDNTPFLPVEGGVEGYLHSTQQRLLPVTTPPSSFLF